MLGPDSVQQTVERGRMIQPRRKLNMDSDIRLDGNTTTIEEIF